MVTVFLSLMIYLLSPPADVKAFDTPNDEGESITVQWKPSADEHYRDFRGYEVYRAEKKEGPFEFIDFVMKGKTEYVDKGVKDGKPYFYRIRAIRGEEYVDSEVVGPAISSPQWFNKGRVNVLIFVVVFGFLVIYYIRRAKKDKSLYIRKIPGLEAIDDAVGRATEMGRPILFSFGLGALTDVVTIAALSILRRIARKAAEYEVRLIIPNYDPIVMAAAQETVRQAYTEAGRPDLYREDDVMFLTSDQFGYAAGVDGLMIRERPGAIFLQGYFFAESLILAETGHSVGAIQIAGTTAITQLPFFIAACDYTLIGEEMYAASAYIDRDPPLLGSIKGEDIAKVIIMVIITATVLLATLGFFVPQIQDIYEKIVLFFETK